MKNYELDINQFVYENELHNFTIEVLNNNGGFKVLTNSQMLTKADIMNIQDEAYNFEYTGASKQYDKMEKFTY